MKIFSSLAFLYFLLVVATFPARAQEPVAPETAAPAENTAASQAPAASEESAPSWAKKDVDAFDKSLFFSPLELAAIERALGGVTLSAYLPEDAKEGQGPDLGPRKLRLAGVLYRAEKDWAVWLNGWRLTPNNLLPEVVGIEVEREKVTLKWFDRGTNRIIFITLRPHQTYDIDTGILLPG